ncbi:MAG: hypothetical protein M1835_006231 [Candelina submexicana]|nr:MAG: hypothetical protein M1835_006231 [Candelina submexicana]
MTPYNCSSSIRAQSHHHALLPVQNGQDVNEHCHSGNSETDDPNSDRQAPCDNDGSPGSRESSIYSSYTAESLTIDQKENWRQLRKALEGVGITPEMFDQRQGFITSRIRELIAGYAFEEEGRLDSDDMSRHQLKEKLLPEHTIYYRQDRVLLAAIEAEDIPRIETALGKGANVNEDPKKTNSVQKIPIGLAIRLGNERIVRLLLEYNADIEVKTPKLWSALWVAAWMGHKDIVQILLDYRADLESMHNDRITPLMAAANKGHTEVVQLLLDHQADVNIKGHDGWAPLHGAAPLNITAEQSSHIEIIQLLLKHGANVDIKDKSGETPLMIAAGSPKPSTAVVSPLLANGANIESTNEDGRSALEYARQYGTMEMEELLIAHLNLKQAHDGAVEPMMRAVDRTSRTFSYAG